MTPRIRTGLTFGTLSALFSRNKGIIDVRRYAVPAAISSADLKPAHILVNCATSSAHHPESEFSPFEYRYCVDAGRGAYMD